MGEPVSNLEQIKIVQALREEYAKYLGQTETKGKNRSAFIDSVNKFMGIGLGAPYCLSALHFGAHQVEQDLSIDFMVPKSGHCQSFYNSVNAKLKFQAPKVGDWGIYRYAGRSTGHAVFVNRIISDTQIETIEFNTGPEKWMNRNGDGVYKKVRKIKGSGLMRLMGFVRIVDAVRPVEIKKT